MEKKKSKVIHDYERRGALFRLGGAAMKGWAYGSVLFGACGSRERNVFDGIMRAPPLEMDGCLVRGLQAKAFCAAGALRIPK